MSRLESGRIKVKPAPNVYTVLAIIAAVASCAAMIFAIIQWNVLVK